MISRILYLATKDIKMIDIPLALEAIGAEVIFREVEFDTKHYSSKACESVGAHLEETKPDIVFTCDFQRCIAECCFIKGIAYVSWVYDCPQEELYSVQAQYNTNYIFVFDRIQCERLKEIGITHVYHMPLAIYPERVKLALDRIKSSTKYENDICMIGTLYYRDSNERLLSLIDEQAKKEWEKIVKKSIYTWDGQSNMYGSMQKGFVDFFKRFEKESCKLRSPYISEQFVYETSILSRYIAHRERVEILNRLSKICGVTLYTRDKKLDELDKKIRIQPGIEYSANDIFQIYNKSKINLNISLHCIESGLSQRIFDVMASGGFLLTNYLPEIEDIFVIGEDLVVYRNLEELEYLTKYYLEHEEERKRIAGKGQQKVLNQNSYESRFNEIISIVDAEEINRKKDREELVEISKDISMKENKEKIAILDRMLEADDAMNMMKYVYLCNSDDLEISMYMASNYIDDNLYNEALTVLKNIKEPNNDVEELIEMLERALS